MEEAGELAFTSTYDCAAHNFCIPCFYKLFPSGKIQIAEAELQLPHNVRPELCPRSSGDSEYTSRIYSSKAKILTVGDGDLTFSRSLAQSFAHQLTATTHESHQSLLKTYPNAPEVLDALRSAGVTMFHEVDATNFESHAEVRTHKFDIVIWNFPCVRIERGADGQVSELEQNQELLRLFFRSVRSILRPKGEVHVTHKTIEPFSWWGLTTLAAAEGLQLFQTIVFDRCNYAGYTNRKVLDKKSFPCNDARVSQSYYAQLHLHS